MRMPAKNTSTAMYSLWSWRSTGVWFMGCKHSAWLSHKNTGAVYTHTA